MVHFYSEPMICLSIKKGSVKITETPLIEIVAEQKNPYSKGSVNNITMRIYGDKAIEACGKLYVGCRFTARGFMVSKADGSIELVCQHYMVLH